MVPPSPSARKDDAIRKQDVPGAYGRAYWPKQEKKKHTYIHTSTSTASLESMPPRPTHCVCDYSVVVYVSLWWS